MSIGSGAVLRGTGQTRSGRIKSGDVPRIHEPGYGQGFTAENKTNDEQVLFDWLEQQGYTIDEILSLPLTTWSEIKTTRFDHGLGLDLSTVDRFAIEGVPIDAYDWGLVAKLYGLDEDVVPDMQQLWETVANDVPMKYTDPTATLRKINVGGNEINAAFDEFVRGYTETPDSSVDAIMKDLESTKALLSNLESEAFFADDGAKAGPAIQELRNAISEMDTYLENRFGERAQDPHVMSDIDRYIATHQDVSSEPLGLDTAEADADIGLTDAEVSVLDRLLAMKSAQEAALSKLRGGVVRWTHRSGRVMR